MASWDSLVTSTLSGLTGVVKAAVIFFGVCKHTISNRNGPAWRNYEFS